MTVESTQNKQTPQQMGTLFEYEFTLDVLVKDPTDVEAMQAIKAKVKQEDGTEIDLAYGIDYSVVLNNDRLGGKVIVTDKRTSDDFITIYREYSLKQEADYQDFNSLPAETLEQCFDKLTMIEQQQQEELDRCVKVGMTSGIAPEILVSQVNRIYDSIDNVDSLANDKENLDIVANDKANIDITATNISSVNATATNIEKVIATADNEANINAAVENETNINIVATDKANIDITATNISSINKTADNEVNINKVADDLFNDNNIGAVADNITNINAAADNEANINAAVENETNINAAVENETNINIVANDKANIDITATNKANIDIVANNVSDVNTTATNISAIIAAPSYASSASASANVATTQANVATAQANLAKQYAEETHGQSDVMVENVRAIPAYTNYEYTQTETKGLNDLKQWNRSTFDLSKFTVVGSPTITNDGILTSNSRLEYVKTDILTQIGDKSWEIRFKGKIPSAGTSPYYIIGGAGWASATPISLGKIAGTSSNEISLFIRGSNGYIVETMAVPASDGITGNDIEGIIRYDGTSIYSWEIYTNNKTFVNSVTSTDKLSPTSATNSFLALGGANTYGVDLKQFSITVDGVEVFNGNKSGIDVITGTLSIPYNLSKTGSKIVDSAYRDRVQSMYNQFGHANYYTLSDTDFTTPMGENMNGHVTKIGWYKNGSTSYEYDTNLDCIETGTCTSGATVMLPKPMADDNYSLSIPYSAKTNVGFIPTASGDYIAKGKILLVDNGGTPPVPPVPPDA